MGELYEIDSILLTVESSFGISGDAVVNHDRVVIARANQKLPGLGECHRVDLVGVLFKDFRYFEALHSCFRDPHRDMAISY